MDTSKQFCLDLMKEKPSRKVITFFGVKPERIISDKCLSNFYPANFSMDGYNFTCSEQAFMYLKAKYFKDVTIMNEIIKTKGGNPSLYKKLGRQVHNFDPDLWGKVSSEFMYKAIEHKFRQNYVLKTYLVKTGDSLLVETNPYDNIWSCGLKQTDKNVRYPQKWTGSNKLGWKLMVLRNKLQK